MGRQCEAVILNPRKTLQSQPYLNLFFFVIKVNNINTTILQVEHAKPMHSTRARLWCMYHAHIETVSFTF